MLSLPPPDRRALPLAALGAFLALSGPASAQDRRPVPVPDPQPEPARETVAGGQVRFVPITDLDDAIPLPGGSRRLEGREESQEIPPVEGGDPHFLGFIAGKHFPPADERVDPLLRQAAAALPAGRENGVTYAFAMFSRRITAERIALLESLGARFLGTHPHYAAKLALPPHAIDAVADLDFVRWVGVPRSWQKLQPMLAEAAASAGAGQELDVWISVYESDLCDASSFEFVGQGAVVEPEVGAPSLLPATAGARRWQSNGWQHQALVAAGAQLVLYSDSIRAFRARLTPAQVAAVRDLDFVQFVELDGVPVLQHEESMPMTGVDLTRPSNSGGSFGNAVVGETDTGIENSHYLLNHIYGVGWDLASSASGPWGDGVGHGSHVAGSLFGGSYSGYEALYGAAPGLGGAADLRIFNVKVFDDSGVWGGPSLADIVDKFHSAYNDGSNVTPRPHVISNSWGTTGGQPYVGSEADCRLLDNETYGFRQLYVFAAGNYGPGASTTIEEASAKNVLTVGNVYPYRSSEGPPDTIRFSSSRGPCGDGRWKPNVMAPGVSIDSADAADLAGFTSKTGTSMSAPHVSGIAAQLVDRYSFLRYNPSTLSAVLMATALSSETHTKPTDGHLDNYGTGRVSAYRAIGGNSYQALYFWGYTQSNTSHAELDFNVNSGATRMTVVMTYHEPSSSAGASQALVQDVDSYIDRDPFTGSGNSGDYYFQISHIDNTEVRTINAPGSGAWKVKTWPTSVTSGSDRPLMGICVVVDYGDTSPDGNLSITSNKAYAKPGETVEVDASITNQSNGSIAQSVYLDANTAGMSLLSVRSNLADGTVSELVDNVSFGSEVMLGDMRHGQNRSVTWEGVWNSEGTKTFSASTLSPTMNATSDSVQVVVDGTPPGLPQNVHSTDHTAGEHSCDLTVAMDWDAASDSLSGVAGYSFVWSHSSSSIPDTVIDTSATSSNTTLSASSQGWWFHVRAIDKAANAGSTVHVGPFYLGEAMVTSYCNSNLNSTGQMALLDTQGPLCLADKQLTLRTTQLPTNKFGYYLFGENKGNVPFFGGSQGVLCISGPIIRFGANVLNSGAGGEMAFSPDLDNLPQGQVFQHGSTWNFQLWYRDNNPGATSNTSNGIEIIWD